MGEAGAGNEWTRVFQCEIVMSQTVKRVEDGHDGLKTGQAKLVLPGFQRFVQFRTSR
jgi:hypothetical protein